MGVTTVRRRLLILALGVCMFVLLLVLITLNAFNNHFLTPATPLQALVFIALSVIAFLLFVGVLVLLVRNILKLYADQRSRVLGTRLRTRMLRGAVLVSLVPLVFMFAFSYLLMNRAVDRWFSQPVTQMRSDADSMAAELYRYANANARSEADSIAVDLASSAKFKAGKLTPASVTMFSHVLQRHDVTLQGGFVLVYMEGHAITSLRLPQSAGATELHPIHLNDSSPGEDAEQRSRALSPGQSGPLDQALLKAAQRTDEPFYSIAGSDYSLATAAMPHSGMVLVALPIPDAITTTSLRLRRSANAYWVLFRQRRQIRGLYTIYLLLITAVALFVCCWLALYLSKQITRPVESVADAMEAIATGDYAYRAGPSATEELGELVESFNAMASDLENAHALAEQATSSLSYLNQTLQARRAELETIIETIPSGVVTLSVDRRILLANRAFSEMLDPGGQRSFIGLSLSEVLPSDIVYTLDHLLRRAHRMGTASTEIEMHFRQGIMHLAATVAILEGAPALKNGATTVDASGPVHFGYVLVLEDATELLRAQKQNAWKEVAQRVAHEIKNPLTPISLNADLIQRHIARLTSLLDESGLSSPSPAIMRRSADVIIDSVQTLRALVDQFSSLAEFPAARPQPADLNAIVDASLALFGGRLGNIRLRLNLSPTLPLVLADPEALKRALSNLIDNAAESMHDSLLRELHISTRAISSAMIELAVADTGPGLTDEMREHLFLPYFSTKQRGTGLGLSIAAKIIQEHHGSIRAERNLPAGARFIIELPPASESAHQASSPEAIPSLASEEQS